jgi:hypothetical protein
VCRYPRGHAQYRSTQIVSCFLSVLGFSRKGREEGLATHRPRRDVALRLRIGQPRKLQGEEDVGILHQVILRKKRE